MYQSVFSFEHLFFSFSSDFTTYQFYFTVFCALNSWIFCVTFHFVPGFFIFVTFGMLWILVTVNKVKHKPHTSQITSSTIATQTFFSVSNKIRPTLVTRFLGNEWWNFPKKTFGSPSKNLDKKEKENKKKKTRMAIVIRKRNKLEWQSIYENGEFKV